MIDGRRPVHLAVLLALSAGAYAVTLAAVTGAQSVADAAQRRLLAPVASGVSSIEFDYGPFEQRLREASDRYTDVAGRYDRIAPRVEDLGAALDALSGSVQQITDTADRLPDRVPLPAVARAPRAVAPTTHAVTGASGG
jgi:hypothetical protein